MQNSRPPLRRRIAQALFPRRRNRLLCYVNHYYGQDSAFRGKSTTQGPAVRRAIVRRTIDSIRSSGLDIDLKVCGIRDHGLVDINIAFTDLPDPRHLVYASIERMASQLDPYDYFLNIEDDIYVPPETLANAMDFDRSESRTEILHPNRMETDAGGQYCVDLRVIPGWTTSGRNYKGRRLAVAINPHSGLMFLSREKFFYARQQVDLSSRALIIGSFMASAYCNVHLPFTLWRSFDDPKFHTVEHLDLWRQELGLIAAETREPAP
jgi:hypothetical protein